MLVGKLIVVGIAVVVVLDELKKLRWIELSGHQYLCVSVNAQLPAWFTIAIDVPRIITATPNAVKSHSNMYLRLKNPLFFSFM